MNFMVFLMRASRTFETRDYPEPWLPCLTETDLEFMASLFLKANPGNKSHLIEPHSNPNRFRNRSSLRWGRSGSEKMFDLFFYS